MITILNQTKKPLTTKIGNELENSLNRRVSISYGSLEIDAFVLKQNVENLVEKINDSFVQLAYGTKFKYNTRLYFSNKDNLPIISETKDNGANVLVLVQELEENSRLVNVKYENALIVERDVKPGKYLAAVISFRADTTSAVTFVVDNGGEVIEYKYVCDEKGEIVSEETQIEDVYNSDRNFNIKPYRPNRPTHLVFTTPKSSTDYLKKLKTNKIVEVNSKQELEEKLNEYKKIGFTAATLVVSAEKDERYSEEEYELVKLLQDTLQTVYLTFKDGYSKNVTKRKNVKKEQRIKK